MLTYKKIKLRNKTVSIMTNYLKLDADTSCKMLFILNVPQAMDNIKHNCVT